MSTVQVREVRPALLIPTDLKKRHSRGVFPRLEGDGRWQARENQSKWML
jgi:hypothetical protein